MIKHFYHMAGYNAKNFADVIKKECALKWDFFLFFQITFIIKIELVFSFSGLSYPLPIVTTEHDSDDCRGI